MSWNGSGTFSRIHDWVTDKANAIGIEATRHDAEDDSFEAGIQACITKNNESKPVADFSPDVDATHSFGTAALRWLNANISGAIKFVGSSFTTTVAYTAPTANRTITLPDDTGTVALIADVVEKTSATGSAVMPAGTTAQRDTAAAGKYYIRYSDTLSQWEQSADGAAWAALGGGGSLLAITAFNSTGSFTKATNNPTYVVVEVWGGGGGGGGSSFTGSVAGGGGAGGYSKEFILASALAASETVTIGAGGTAGSTGGSSGGTGGTTSFGTTPFLSSTGGSGGQGATSIISRAGGVAGAGSGGDINKSGMGGGRSAANVTHAFGKTGDGGITSLGGNGRAIAGAANTAGNAGVANSGSGGSGGSAGGSIVAGGVGGSGFVVVYEYS